MSILFDHTDSTLTLTTQHTTYQMQIASTGHLLHLYYGRRSDGRFDHLYLPHDCGFSPNPYELRDRRGWSLDTLPQEYSGANTGDYRLSSLLPAAENGAWGADLRYVRHTVKRGKYGLQALPAAFDRGEDAETLRVTLADPAVGIEVELLYGVYEAQDVITRAARVTNVGGQTVRLEKVASLCLDLPFGDWELLHFHGRHCMERQPERVPLMTGIQTVASKRGMSSHQHNPFVILCDREATEDHGDCYGVMPVWSGDHKTEIEVDQRGSTRVVSGVHDEHFSWTLAPGESFVAPEVLLTFSHEGLTKLSQTYHRFLRNNLCRSEFSNAPRPVLLNNWEATYFDFDAEKLLEIAREAKGLGVDLFVLDDGWFGTRNDDNGGLGDWFVNEQKLPGGLAPLIKQINDMGLKFGLWIEPEMVSEDSALYRAHPDWALTVPGRKPTMGRNQLVLDMARPEVVEYLYETLSALLCDHHIEYIKWDMNRGLSDVYSHTLPPERQGEVSYRYVLGVYSLLERLTTAFPDVLFEGCAGGGGRFDAGILAYCPQIWCSDDTDAVERLAIQYGTSFGYPASAMGAHVSASPNHQTGRSVPLEMRAIVAMSGAFGYELDPTKLSEDEKQSIRAQIARYRKYDALVRTGDCYRLTDPRDGRRIAAWQFVSEDGSEALLNVVVTHPEANPRPLHLRLKGLDPQAVFAVEGQERSYTGAALMYGGYTLAPLYGDYPAAQLYLRRL